MNNSRINGGGISVVVPIYNAEKYIESCINSIRNQTMPNLEIICVNDGSKDGTLAILQRLSAEDSRIQIVDVPNGGASRARNIGIAKANMKYIAFVDSDDTIDDTMYDSMYQMAEKQNLDCVCCGFKVWPYNAAMQKVPVPFSMGTVLKDDNILNQAIKPIIGFSNMPNAGLSALWNKLFLNRSIRKNNLRINESRTHGEDWQFCIDYYMLCSTIGFIDDCFYNYYHHTPVSLVSRFRPNAFRLSIEDGMRLRAQFPNLDWNSEHKQIELRTMPIRSALYYRLNHKNVSMQLLYEDMMSLCKSYEDFLFQLPVKEKWETELRLSVKESDIHSFMSLLNKQTSGAYRKEKIKNTARRLREHARSCIKSCKQTLWGGVQTGYLIVNSFFKCITTFRFLMTKADRSILMNSWVIARYGRMVKRNFGDELNMYLIEGLTGRKATALNFSFLSHHENLMMIGSVIESFCNEETLIWGAGALFGGNTKIHHRPKKVFAVRGPHTREFLLSQNIDCPEVYGDPALLTPILYKPKVRKLYKVGIIPHVIELNDPVITRIASMDGVHLISFVNYRDWHNLIDEILQCEVILSSSLHGLILSDAYNVPNVWVTVKKKMGGTFKYFDYFDSVQRTFCECIRLTENSALDDIVDKARLWSPIKFDPRPLLQACPLPEIAHMVSCNHYL